VRDHKNIRGLDSGILPVIQLCLPPTLAVVTLLGLTVGFGNPVFDIYRGLAVVAFIVTLMVFREVNRSAAPRDLEYLAHVGRVFGPWLLVFGLLAVMGYALKISAEYSRRVLLSWALFTPFVIGGGQLLFDRIAAARWRVSGQGRSAVIAGVNRHSRRLGQSLKQHPRLGMRLVGYFDDRGKERIGPLEPGQLLGKLEDLPDYVRRTGTEVIYIALPIPHEERTRQIIDELQDTTASIYFVPDVFVFDLIRAQVDMIDGIPILALRESPFVGMNQLVKRLSDLVLASALLLLTAPVLLVITACIKVTTPGSVIFQQRRYGLDGHEIIVYKFRTMTTSDDSDEIPQATCDDARVTPIGRFLRRYSLDELPQLINVLQGRMSMVGPRPHAVAHNEMYRKLIKGYMGRHKVTPGITGLAQVNGLRGETKSLDQMATRVAYDLEYLRSWSLGLDLKIIFKTILTVFRDRKAY
jgi:putative colanic acid biosynthesis UDP-glucose lipid carrier transferase